MFEPSADLLPQLFHDTRILVLEGPDGVGKTTLVNKIKAFHVYTDLEVVQVRCPDNRGDAAIRACILGETIAAFPMAQAFLFMADFLLAYESVIKPKLDDPRVVFLFDRFIPSTCLYQKLELDYLNQVFEAGYPEFAEAFSLAKYVYLHPGNLDTHRERLAKKQGEEVNHLDPKSDDEVMRQIMNYYMFSLAHEDKGLLGSRRVERLIV